MAGNRKAFKKAMETAADAAWDGEWERAIEAYQRALEMSPDNANALSGLGLSYANAGRWADALEAYEEANEKAPQDAGLLERIAEAHEKLGHKEAAAKSYLTAAEIYLKEDQAEDLALERWKDAARVDPQNVQAHVNLLKHYQRHNQPRKVVEQCLGLARIHQEQDQIDTAIQICEYALKLSPRNSKVLSLLDKLRYEEQEQPEQAREEEETVSDEELDMLTDLDAQESLTTLKFGEELQDEEDGGSPVDHARQRALSDLAKSFFDEEVATTTPETKPSLSKAEIDALIGKAIDLQTRGQVEEAIDTYERVIEAGVERPAVHFNLGLLYQEKLRFEAAISQFERTVDDPSYRLGSEFAIGECYRARGRIEEALEHFVEALKIVDMATVSRDHVDDLIQLYEHLADGYIAKGDKEQALEFTNSLVTFLSEQGWEDKIQQARHRLDALAQQGPTLSLAEMLTLPNSDEVLESVALSQEYAKRKLCYAALEELYYALDHAPTYLPIHRQIAQILLEMGNVDDCVSKLVCIGDAYRTRGNARQGIAIYRQALRLAPMNTAVRAKLIDILISHGEIDAALEQYLNLADSFYQQAQMNEAREIYQEALRLAPRGSSGRRWEVRILHKIADIDMQLVDWHSALEIYGEIRDLAPDDERARLALMELNYRFGRQQQALGEIDALLRIYRERGNQERMFAVLEDLVNQHPESIPLHARLAQVTLDAGEKEKALERLDKLGDLQLEAGRVQEAKSTIEAIILLQPPNVKAYRQLLEQLEQR